MKVALALFLVTPFAWALEPGCLTRLEDTIQQEQLQQQMQYLQVDPHQGAIRPGNEALLLKGTNTRAHLVLHGFAASPFEVKALAEKLHKQGATVYAPLLFGFGSSAKVANSATYHDWRRQIRHSLELLSLCFDDVSLSGFSTGGTLVTEFLLGSPDLTEDGIFQGRLKVSSAALFSPYLKTHNAMMNLLNSLMGQFTDSVSVASLYTWSANKDLQAMVNFPDFYNRDLPLKAAEQVMELGKVTREIKRTRPSKVPLFVAWSFADQTIDPWILEKFYGRRFESWVKNAFSRELEFPHQILLLSANPWTNWLVDRAVLFLNGESIITP